MAYNLTNFTAANNFLDLTVASNNLVDGWLAVMVVVLIFGISFLSMKSYQMSHALLSSAFVTFILTASLWGVGVASERAVVITFVLLLTAIVVEQIAE